MKEYNTTQLEVDKTFERHVFHRDQFAHYIRWSHVLKNAKIGDNVLDFGSGTGNLLEVLYRNRFKCNEYLGLEYRQSTVNKSNLKYSQVDWARFIQTDLTQENNIYDTLDGEGWDKIVCFEVAEHVGKKNVPQFLKNLHDNMSEKTVAYISTPCYDPVVGAANNHIINGEICEMTQEEFLKHLDEADIDVEKIYGTFASIKDYAHLLNEWQLKMYTELRDYFDTSLLSNIMAPFFPQQSRNALYICKRRK